MMTTLQSERSWGMILKANLSGQLNRRWRVENIIWFFLLAVSFAIASSVSAEKSQPNVLFIITDDQSFDTIHSLGNAHIQTLNMDRQVRECFTFRNAYIIGGKSLSPLTDKQGKDF